MAAAALALAERECLLQFTSNDRANQRPGKESRGKRKRISLMTAQRRECAVERRLRIGSGVAVAVDGNSFGDGSTCVACNAHIADGGSAGCEIDDHGIAA